TKFEHWLPTTKFYINAERPKDEPYKTNKAEHIAPYLASAIAVTWMGIEAGHQKSEADNLEQQYKAQTVEEIARPYLNDANERLKSARFWGITAGVLGAVTAWRYARIHVKKNCRNEFHELYHRSIDTRKEKAVMGFIPHIDPLTGSAGVSFNVRF
ncbi:MAG: hypothetical protein R3301_19195, partial [Saprospiraceae bacterium]|nr:hypothetical protein [Saprospiraceae bacterium]